MDEEQWRYDTIMYEKVDMSVENEESGVNEENGEEPGVHQHIDCSYTFDTSQVLI